MSLGAHASVVPQRFCGPRGMPRSRSGGMGFVAGGVPGEPAWAPLVGSAGRAAERPAPLKAAGPEAQDDPPAPLRRDTALAQLARCIVRRAQGA